MIAQRLNRSAIAWIVGIAMAAATLSTLSARAQEMTPEHLAAARQAVAASRSTLSMDIILPNLGESAKQQLIDSRPDKADVINTIVDEATIELAPRRGDLEEEVARIYANVFTVEELNAIAEFYRTDAGRKLIRETPVIARSLDEAARVWSTGIQRDLQQAINKKIEEGALN